MKSSAYTRRTGKFFLYAFADLLPSLSYSGEGSLANGLSDRVSVLNSSVLKVCKSLQRLIRRADYGAEIIFACANLLLSGSRCDSRMMELLYAAHSQWGSMLHQSAFQQRGGGSS